MCVRTVNYSTHCQMIDHKLYRFEFWDIYLTFIYYLLQWVSQMWITALNDSMIGPETDSNQQSFF